MKRKPLSYVGLVGSMMAVLGCAAIAQDTKREDPNVQIVNGPALGKLMDLPKDTIALVAITGDGAEKFFVPQGGDFKPVKIVTLPHSIGNTRNLEILELRPATSLTLLRFRHNPTCLMVCKTVMGFPICTVPTTC